MISELSSDIFSEFENSPVLYLKEPWSGDGIFDKDTGLCNRLFYWELADLINQKHDYKFNICLEEEYWPELYFLNLPKTHFHNKTKLNHYFRNFSKPNTIELDLKNINSIISDAQNKLDTNKNYISSFDYTFTNDLYKTNYELLNRGIKKISIKNKNIENFLLNFLDDVIGIHIRRGYGVQKNQVQINYLNDLNLEVATKDPLLNRSKYYKFVDDKTYFEVIDGVLNINPNQKFYISTDLGMNSLVHFVEKYKENIITYEDILNNVMYNFIGMNLKDYQYYYQHIINILDLFALSYCNLLIRSSESSWSDFAQYYREIPTIDISSTNEQIVDFINEKNFINV